MGQSIILKMSKSNKIMILWEGAIEVQVSQDNKPNQNQNIWFENLNRGSCFNVFCPFSETMLPVVNYIPISEICTILSIDANDLIALSSKHPELKTIMENLNKSIRHSCNLDFFRFQKKYLDLDAKDEQLLI